MNMVPQVLMLIKNTNIKDNEDILHILVVDDRITCVFLTLLKKFNNIELTLFLNFFFQTKPQVLLN